LLTTSPRVGSSSTTSPPQCVRVPRLVAQLVMRLVVDYFASRRLVIDYFTSAERLVNSARRAARHRLLRLAHARRRLHHLRRVSGCFGTSRGLSRDSSLTTSPARRRLLRLRRASGCLGTRAARHAARRRLLHIHLAQARRRLLHIHRASGCFGTSRGLSHDSLSTTSPRAGSSSTTLPPPCVRVPRHVHGSSRGSLSTTSPSVGSSSTTSPTPRVRLLWHVAPLVVDYFASVAHPGASARRAARHAARRRLLHPRHASG
jgi:hypothetical protein